MRPWLRKVIGPRGELVLPKAVRDALNLHPGTEVELEVRSEGLLIRSKDPEVVAWFEAFARKHKVPAKDIPTSDAAYEERFG
jgi:AbrB family looped-hinge helix DNA binding protein